MIISSGLTFLLKGINNEYLLDDLTVFCAFGTSCMTFHFDLIDFWEQFYLSKTPCVKAIRLIDISSNRPYLLFLGNDLRRNFFTRKAKSWWQWPPCLLKKKKKKGYLMELLTLHLLFLVFKPFDAWHQKMKTAKQ